MFSNKINNAISRDLDMNYESKLNLKKSEANIRCPVCDGALSIFDDKCSGCGALLSPVDFEATVDKSIGKAMRILMIADGSVL